MEYKTKQPSKHIGRKIGRMREVLGIKQETVADKLGITQQAVSKIEQSENVEEVMLERVAEALGVNAEAIKNFNEDTVVYNIQNNYEGSSLNLSPNQQQNHNCTFNPIDKWVEAMEENRRLQEENKKLYEELLKSEREKVVMLQSLLDKKK